MKTERGFSGCKKCGQGGVLAGTDSLWRMQEVKTEQGFGGCKKRGRGGVLAGICHRCVILNSTGVKGLCKVCVRRVTGVVKGGCGFLWSEAKGDDRSAAASSQIIY